MEKGRSRRSSLCPPDTPEQTQPPETEPTKEPQPDGGYQVRIAQVLTVISGQMMSGAQRAGCALGDASS